MIELEPFSRGDFHRVIAWSTSCDFLFQWAGPIFAYPLDQSQLEDYLQTSMGDQPTRRIYKAIDRDNGVVVGHIELNNIDRNNGCATVSRVLIGEASARGRGLGREMLRRILEIGFDHLKLHRLDLVVYDFNEPAITCYERVGFRKEGLLREIRRLDDRYYSLFQMSILEAEYRAVGSQQSAS